MGVFELFFIAVAMSCEIFAKTICESSSYVKVDKNKLLISGFAFGIWEILALILGYYTIDLLIYTGVAKAESSMIYLISVVIMLILSVHLLIIGIKRNIVIEHRLEHIKLMNMLTDNAKIGFRTYLMGIALAACGTNLFMEIGMIMVVSLIIVVGGLYIGYRYGYGSKGKVCCAGAIILGIIGIIAFTRYLI